ASRCAVECRRIWRGSSLTSWSPYPAMGSSSIWTPMNWTAIVDALGYPSAGLGILIESSGVPFPGEALLLAAAAWAAIRHHSLALVILFGFLGATAGADLGYLLGYRGG